MSSPGSISDPRALTAEVLSPDRGERLARAFDAIDRAAGFVNTSRWTAADAAVLGPERTVWVAFVDAHGSVLGTTALVRTATWRSGTPATRTLTWPAARLGRGFRPRWRAMDREIGQRGWLAALRQAFPDVRFDLPNTAADALADPVPPLAGMRRDASVTLWSGEAGPDLERHCARLDEARATRLEEGRLRIEGAGGQWRDHDHGGELSPALAQVFALHRARMMAKGRPRAVFGADDRAFFAALAEGSPGLRLSVLTIEGKTAAGALAFVAQRRFQGYVAGWSPTHADLDLDRQVWWHAIRRELMTRGLTNLDLPDDDGHADDPFALARQPLLHVRLRPGAGLGAQLVGGVLHALGRRPPPKPEVPA